MLDTLSEKMLDNLYEDWLFTGAPETFRAADDLWERTTR
jgi:hypothetical protein